MKFHTSFDLTQHTPHLHFQHNQEQCSVRATELKPKLDKFLLTKNKDSLLQSGAAKEKVFWLNYKVKVIPGKQIMNEFAEEPKLLRNSSELDRDSKGMPKLQSYPMYFGNMGLDIEKEENLFKKLIMYDNVKIIFHSLHPILIDNIERYMPEFLATHNFGNRQSKGFGSYYFADVDLNNKYPAEKFLNYRFRINTDEVKLPSFITFSERSEEYINYFKLKYALNLFYSSLRSGINFGGLYFKALIFLYAKKHDIQWDKKTIRDKFHLFTDTYRTAQKNRTDPNGTFLYTAKEKRLMRDMLGLSSEQTWMAYGDTIKKENDTIDRDDTIDRFKSPITLKVFRASNNSSVFEVGIHPEDIPLNYFDNKFKITSKRHAQYGELILKTPTLKDAAHAGEFNLKDFLNFSFTEVFKTPDDFEKHINYKTSSESLLLKNIYNQLIKCKPLSL